MSFGKNCLVIFVASRTVHFSFAYPRPPIAPKRRGWYPAFQYANRRSYTRHIQNNTRDRGYFSIRHFSARLASGTQNTAQMMDELLNCPEGIAYYIRTLRTQLLNRQTSNEDIAYFNERFFANPRRISRDGIRLRILRTSWVVDAHRRHFNAAPTSEQETELVNIVESRDLQTDTAVNAYILSLVNVASAGTTVVSTTSGTSSEAASQPVSSSQDASAQPDGCE